jgi:ribokinase
VANESEASLLSGVAVDGWRGATEAATELRRLGCAVAIVTLGAEGLVLADERGCRHHPAHAVAAVDTTGAGDCFVGALAAALSGGLHLDAAIAFAQRAAAFSVQHHGAQASMPTSGDLRNTLHEIDTPV